MRKLAPCVYILASGPNGTLYIGVTSNLYDRMAQHAQKLVPGFTARHGVTRLVYYELHASMPYAIRREKHKRFRKSGNRFSDKKRVTSNGPQGMASHLEAEADRADESRLA